VALAGFTAAKPVVKFLSRIALVFIMTPTPKIPTAKERVMSAVRTLLAHRSDHIFCHRGLSIKRLHLDFSFQFPS
jgi:hypothetical protein